jgi:Glycosyl transferase family 2
MLSASDIAAVSLVRDEASIIRLSLDHLYDLGIRRYVLMDHGSTDGTRSEIEHFRSQRHDAVVMLIDDPSPVYAQSAKITAMASLAHHALGSSWILPFDADEFLWWPAFQAGPLELPDIDYIRLPWVHFHPADILPEDYGELHRTQKSQSGVESPTRLGKVLIKWRDDLVIMSGHHGLRSLNRSILRSVQGGDVGIGSAHFPIRTIEHLKKRITNKRPVVELATADQFVPIWQDFNLGAEHRQKLDALYAAFMTKDIDRLVNECLSLNVVPKDLGIVHTLTAAEPLLRLPIPSEQANRQVAIQHIIVPKAAAVSRKTRVYAILKGLQKFVPKSVLDFWWRQNVTRLL